MFIPFGMISPRGLPGFASKATLPAGSEFRAGQRTKFLLQCSLLAMLGLSAYTRSGWAVLGTALLGGVLATHEFLMRKVPAGKAKTGGESARPVSGDEGL